MKLSKSKPCVRCCFDPEKWPLTYAPHQLRQIRFPLSQTRILLRRPPSSGKDAGWPFRLSGWLQRVFRIQVWGDVSRGRQLHFHEDIQRPVRSSMHSSSLLHRPRAQLQTSCRVASNIDGSLRELICHHFAIHLTGLDASLLHLYNNPVLGKIPPITERKLFTRVVLLAVLDRH
jgi:hypothetical protein